ncbi:MAG: prefoldin subunit beta [Desulfurococcaceae archaeon]|jgi:prefoldin beta subunit|nr:prefoldin subunit beta [Desulfurococcaceae archaeon]
MAERVPPEIQQQAIRYQQIQAQLNQLIAEKSVLEQELREINRALEVLKNVPNDAEIYRASGHLLIKINKETAEKELNERKELLELRLKTLSRQESLLRQQLSEIQSKLSEYISLTYKKS